jgi:NAD(P)-dependent dehydrogenase (short-subunit alcohol dehydrogenase family)
MRICVIDGQGGGIGAALIKRLKEVYREEHEVIALGTNAVATAQMMLPLTQEPVEIVGLSPEPLPHLVDKIVSQKLKEIFDHV